MHHPKSRQSKTIRYAIISAAILCVTVTGCGDQQPTDPKIQSSAEPRVPGVARTDNAVFSEFFLAWSRSYSSYPIQTQMFAVDGRQDRQYAGLYPDESVLAFARANPGHLYINGDEPDQYCFDPYEYAGIYRNFVTQIRGADPTARVSPAGFAEPNGKCCPEESMAPCWVLRHSISFAEQFWDAYIRRYGEPPRVDEWRFHDFGIAFGAGDMAGWWDRVQRLVAWSEVHGAKMVLGGWGFHGWREPVPVFQEHMKQAMGLIASDSRIAGAVYWSYEPWIESPRPLVDDGGGLTLEGQTYANPMTDVPNSLKLVGSANGLAKVRWSNTTAAWGAEVEFWSQAPGSSSFAYYKTERVGAQGASQTPAVALAPGSTVKARVRYYNAFGAGAWSAFSNTASLALAQPQAEQGKGFKNSPDFCFLRSC